MRKSAQSAFYFNWLNGYSMLQYYVNDNVRQLAVHTNFSCCYGFSQTVGDPLVQALALDISTTGDLAMQFR